MNGTGQLYSSETPNHLQLDHLFKEYYDRLVFFSWQITQNKQQAEDIAQDAFVTYWQQRDEVASHPVAIKNFLYRTVRNASLNVLRHEQVVGKFETAHPGIEKAEAYILESIIAAEIITEVNSAINALPPHLIKLTRLSFLEGKKNHEVAEELNMSVNTVKKQKQRVLELLRIRLHPQVVTLFISYGYLFSRK